MGPAAVIRSRALRRAARAWRDGHPGTACDIMRDAGMTDQEIIRVYRVWVKLGRRTFERMSRRS